jgi:putative ABC transport system permease protein
VDALVGGGASNLPAPGAVKQVTIIGILADVSSFGPLKPPPQTVFVPHTLRAPARRLFVLRTTVEPAALLNSVRTALRALDKEQPMLQPVTFEELIDEQAKAPRFNMALFAVLAGMSLALAAAGIYSVLSYAVAQRSREIGVRMALGAQPRDVQKLFLGRGGVLIGTGMLVGLALSAGLARILRNQIPDLTTPDPLGILLAIGLLAVLGFLACLLPARRAAKVDPMVALRAE